MCSLATCVTAYKYNIDYALFFSKCHYLDVLLCVGGSCVRNALLTICSFFVGLCLDVLCRTAVHCGLSTTVGVDGLPMCEVLRSVCAVRVRDPALCAFLL